MANLSVIVPNQNIVNRFGNFSPEVTSQMNKQIVSVEQQYGSIIDEVAKNSNIPRELIIAMIIAISNGQNNGDYKSVDGLIRSGLFGLSQKTAKLILATEMGKKRMSVDELNYLRNNDSNIASYLSDDKGKKSFNEHWDADYRSNYVAVNDNQKSKILFDLKNPKVSIQIGAIWLGQVWDKFSEQTNNPIDKVVITMLLPYNEFGAKWLHGNNFARNRSWNIDYTSQEWIDKLPKPVNDKSLSNIINPYKGWVGTSLIQMLNRGGLIYELS